MFDNNGILPTNIDNEQLHIKLMSDDDYYALFHSSYIKNNRAFFNHGLRSIKTKDCPLNCS